MKRRWLVGGVGALVVAGVAGAWFSGVLQPPSAVAKAGADAKDGKDARKGKDGKPDVPLEFVSREVVQPALARMPALVEFSGPLVAPQTAIVRAKAGGTLLALNVAEGSRVTAGEALGRVDLAELSSRVAERDANLASARATLTQAERTHASNERLASQQFISPIALENSRAAVDTARAALNAAQAALETTRVSLRDASLVAPISGIVSKKYVVPGEKLTAEQQLLTIVDLANLELAGSVGTHEVSRLAPGMPVQVSVEGMSQPFTGRIARIAPAAEPGTRSIGVVVGLANPKETLRAGQYAVARVTLADDTERLTVPVAAVGNTSGQDYLWLIENGVLARRAITVGRRDEREGRVEVLGGVTPGSQVLAARFDNLREGAKANVVATRSAAVASAAASTPANLK
jgi:RND family efflux transporter MFP subunit